jgi:protein-S-isoprenylcysteine O-methyltransferase Ste14
MRPPESDTPTSVTFRGRLLDSAAFFERYVLSAFYFWLAYEQGLALQTMALRWPAAGEVFTTPLPGQAANAAVLFLVQLLIGAFLLMGRKPARPPRHLREIFVPLASCGYFVLYSLVPRLPEGLAGNVFGGPVPSACVGAGLLLGLAGAALSLWGVVTLGKSFGIFVSVRLVVLDGPYRFVRHPIYLGYAFIWLGLCLINLSPAVWVLVLGQWVLFRFRARMEEQGLVEASPEYARYQRKTGFLFPGRAKGEPNHYFPHHTDPP